MMEISKSMRDKVVKFNYFDDNGSSVSRLVLVEEVVSDRVIGQDLNKNEACQCLFSRIENAEVVNKNTRTKTTSIPFVDARDALHDQINELCGEDLAEFYAEMYGADSGSFSQQTGLVTTTEEVLIPHCKLNQQGQVVGIDWFNEEGEIMTVRFEVVEDSGLISLTVNKEPMSAEEAVVSLSNHLE